MSRAVRTRFAFLILDLALAGAWSGAAAQSAKPAKPSAQAIQVLNIQSDEVKLPPDFQMALYENLIGQIKKTGRFPQVFRDGDKDAAGAADLVTLRANVRGFKQGSERARQVTTVAGATSIKVHVQIAAHDGKPLLEQDVEGKVRFFGGNLRATYNLAKAVAKLVSENFAPAAPAARAASK